MGARLDAHVMLDCFFQSLNKIGAFPPETAVGVWGAAKMAIGRAALIDRFVHTKLFTDATRGQIHDLVHGLFDQAFVDVTGAMCVSID